MKEKTYEALMRGRFAIGQKYVSSGRDTIEILARTAHYVTYTDGRVFAKKKIRKDQLFGDAEYILVPSGHPGMNYFCVADDKIS